MYESEYEKLHKVGEGESFERGKELLEELINLDFKDPRLATRVEHHPDPIFHFRLSEKRSGGPPYKCVKISKKNETLSREDRKRAIENWKSMDRGATDWQKLNIQKQWIPNAAVSSQPSTIFPVLGLIAMKHGLWTRQLLTCSSKS